jgi:DNA uptake protein ComE-like DNA-binding protein
VEHDPGRARALGIGRPDVDGAYDGGVVDLNQASEEAIARATGVDKEIVARIVANREDLGGYRSVEELGALLDVPAHVVDDLRDRAVFLPL